MEKKGGEKVVSRRTGREGGEEEGKGMNRRIEKNRGAGGGLCSVLFILSVQVDNKKDRTEKNEIIIVIMINKKTKFEPLAPCLFFRELQHNGLSFFLSYKKVILTGIDGHNLHHLLSSQQHKQVHQQGSLILHVRRSTGFCPSPIFR